MLQKSIATIYWYLMPYLCCTLYMENIYIYSCYRRIAIPNGYRLYGSLLLYIRFFNKQVSIIKKNQKIYLVITASSSIPQSLFWHLQKWLCKYVRPSIWKYVVLPYRYG